MVGCMAKLRGNPWAVLVVVSLGFFMTLLDLTIVNIAIPDMINRLHASLDGVLWVLNAYALVLAVLVITAGRLGDLIGPRTMFVAGIAVFTVASAACGLAPGAGWLIGFRAVQGLGAAMLMPQTLAILALLAICYGLVEGQRYDWGTVYSFISIPLIIAAGVVLLAVFLLVQKLRQEREPLIPFALFRNRNFTLMNWVSCTLSIGMLGIFLPLTIYLQSALGFSALKAGLTLAPSSLVMIAVAPFLGRLTDKTGGKYILICGLTLFAVGMGWVVLIATPHSTWYDFLPALIVAGLGMGGTFAPLTTVAMREVDPRMAGAASGVLNTTRQVGSVIGTAAVGALLQNRLAASLTSQASIRSAGLPAPVREHFVSGFRQSAASGVLTGGPAGSAPGGAPG